MIYLKTVFLFLSIHFFELEYQYYTFQFFIYIPSKQPITISGIDHRYYMYSIFPLNLFNLLNMKNLLLKIFFLFVMAIFMCFQSVFAKIGNGIYDSETKVILNSYSFNAKKKSHFFFGSNKESVSRGLTIVHFNSASKYEHKSFDTYSSTTAFNEFISVISTMIEENAKFAVLAHDSAVQGVFKDTQTLNKLGFSQLPLLRGRQAYVMHNLNGQIFEEVNDIAITSSLIIGEEINNEAIYFPREVFEFEDSIDRYIAHAGGAIEGHAYTNTKNALDANYKKGFRLFELDIIETSDNQIVAAHDWNMWSRFTEYKGQLPPTLEEFKKHNIYGDYITLDMDGINTWFAEHPDAILVTDKVNDPVNFANSFVDKNRLIMELFSPYSIEEAIQNGIEPMISQEALLRLKGNKLNYLKVNNIKYAAVSRRIIFAEKELMMALRDNGIKVYVYNVNFDEGKDEAYVYENELGLVFGMYADNWFSD